MLRDRGLLTEVDGVGVVAGDLTSFEVPRRCTRSSPLASMPFPRRSGACSRTPRSWARPLLAAGSRHSRADRRGDRAARDETDPQGAADDRDDPFSPERGQLGFLQALIQRITYETIGRRDRRRRHLAAARFLATDTGIDPDEIAEVIASHYLDAHQADAAAEDGDDVRAEARHWFTRAAERAASLAASLEAQRRSNGLPTWPATRRNAVVRWRVPASSPSWAAGSTRPRRCSTGDRNPHPDRRARRSSRSTGPARRAAARLEPDRGGRGPARTPSSRTRTSGTNLRSQPSRRSSAACCLEGRSADALPHVERALDLSERLLLLNVVVQALINKALIVSRPRPIEGLD